MHRIELNVKLNNRLYKYKYQILCAYTVCGGLASLAKSGLFRQPL